MSVAATVQLPAPAPQLLPPSGWKDPALRMARRITYGLTPDVVQLARKLGPWGYLEYQLQYERIDDTAVNKAVLQHFPRMGMSVQQLHQLQDDYTSYVNLTNATAYRAVYSKRQLYERMVEFWRDHFNTFVDKIGAEQQIPYERDVIRPYAMSTFPDLLKATAHSAGMMIFLDNANSYAGNPNQNYARELMELHTLSSSGGYTQKDVIEVARCLTGWGYQWDDTQPNYGAFLFDPGSHDNDAKVVLGTTIPAGGGQNDGEIVLDLLSSHPSTARFITSKMYKWFVGASPTAAIQQKLSSVYLGTRGNIRAILRAIFAATAVITAPPKLKRPFHLFVSALRVLRPQVDNFNDFRDSYLSSAGHVPFEWGPPNGYPDATGYWGTSVLPRWDFCLALANNQVSGITFDVYALLGNHDHDLVPAQSYAYYINHWLAAEEIPLPEMGDLVRFLAVEYLPEERVRAAVALALASPSFQWY